MRGLLCAGWIGLLFVFTCIWDVTEMNGASSWVPQLSQHPDWSKFFSGYRLEGDMLVRKIGHVLGFAVLQILLYRRLRSYAAAMAATAAVAVLTELLQPLFFRGGRALDVLVDLAGMALATAALFFAQRIRRFPSQGKTRARIR